MCCRQADLAIVVVGATSGESVDRPNLTLEREGDELVAAVANISGTKTVVLMQICGAVLMPWRTWLGWEINISLCFFLMDFTMTCGIYVIIASMHYWFNGSIQFQSSHLYHKFLTNGLSKISKCHCSPGAVWEVFWPCSWGGKRLAWPGPTCCLGTPHPAAGCPLWCLRPKLIPSHQVWRTLWDGFASWQFLLQEQINHMILVYKQTMHCCKYL